MHFAGWFVVDADGDERLKKVGVCFLAVDVDAVKIYELNASDVKLVTWPIGCIKRFGCHPLRFSVETGRCDVQPNVLCFADQLAL